MTKRNLNHLLDVLDQNIQASKPFAVTWEDSVVVTDGSFLFEWPMSMVKCDISELESHSPGHDRLKRNHWVDELLQGGGLTFVDEVEPMGREVRDTIVTFKVRKTGERVHYHWTNIELVEYFVKDPYYMLYLQPIPDYLMRMMVVYEDDREVGVFANKTLGS